jgi:hypothetical protein
MSKKLLFKNKMSFTAILTKASEKTLWNSFSENIINTLLNVILTLIIMKISSSTEIEEFVESFQVAKVIKILQP